MADLTPPPAGPSPSFGNGYNSVYPLTGLSALTQGLQQGLVLGNQMNMQAQDMGLRRQAMQNEAEYRDAMLGNRAAHEQAMEPYFQARIDKLEHDMNKPQAAAAGQPINVPGLPPGTVAITDGHGGVKFVKPPSAGLGGGNLAERQQAANRFLDQLEEKLKSVPQTPSGDLGRPVGWWNQFRAWENSSSPQGQLEALVNTGGPTVASAVSNRVNEAEIERQLKEFGKEAFSRTAPANTNVIETMRNILTAPTPYSAGVPPMLGKAAGVGQDQHSQAISWARANPKDPRSAQILKLNGL